jgi:hypothetical protein
MKHDKPRYADLRSGRLYRGDDEALLTAPRLIFLLAAAVVWLVLGIMTAPDIAVTPTEPGFEICMGGRC